MDKTVSVTHLVSTITAILIAATFMSRQDTRITLLEADAISQRRDISDFKLTVRDDLKSINGKLDRLIERK